MVGMRINFRYTTVLAVVAVQALVLLLSPVMSAEAASPMQKGATVYGKSPIDYATANYRASIDSLVETGATDVGLLYPIYQHNVTSSDLFSGWNTPTLDALSSGVQYAHRRGLRVMLTLKADTLDGAWHADINPANRDAWFASYRNWLMKLAVFANNHNVEQLSVGTELYKVASNRYNSDNTWRWQQMIRDVRAIYKGKLVYGSQHTGDRSELLELGYANQLDSVGVSAYFPLTDKGGDSQEQNLELSWARHEQRVAAAQRMYDRPIVFTEAGYRSVNNSHLDPYSYWRQGSVDLGEQARNYHALFSFWNDKPYYAGTYIWAWEVNPFAGGANDTSFSPQNKPAQATLCSWYRHDGAKTCGAHDTPIKSDAEQLEVHMVNSDHVSSNDSLISSTNESQSTPSTGNTQDAATPVLTHSPQRKPTQQSQQVHHELQEDITVWWPNQQAVRGNQPIRALVEGRQLGSYEMYWTVDDNNLQRMQNDNAPSDHKEGLAETWRWGAGTHTITFIAKDMKGRLIATRSQTVTVL